MGTRKNWAYLIITLLVITAVTFIVLFLKLMQPSDPSTPPVIAARPVTVPSQASPSPQPEKLIKRAKLVKTAGVDDPGPVRIILSNQGEEKDYALNGENGLSCVPDIYSDNDMEMFISRFNEEPFELKFGSRIFPTEYYVFFDEINKYYEPGTDILFVLQQNTENMYQFSKFIFLGCPKDLVSQQEI